MIYTVDIDGTLCIESPQWWHYAKATPITEAIKKVNSLFGLGHTIILFTARYEKDRIVTKIWLDKYKVRYHKLVMGKPRADIYIDNAARRMNEI